MSLTGKRETDSKVDETEAQNFVLLLQKCREVSAYSISFFYSLDSCINVCMINCVSSANELDTGCSSWAEPEIPSDDCLSGW